ncbi:glycolate oxidase subunit GlcF [Neomegalonema perideroedes]|uniref:glycolate oxidase subunit GlcF n=1 Tax=Neomegalonema perideroedes TaxID=217219 RepID=UPI00036878DA|nr:glycolate oxidase subunit GlcF [Neomegalonema perideroedes]
MQTNFTPELLKDPDMARSESVLRRCVHCGFCTATCPTFQLLGDEADSPRGRIYMIKDMLEANRPADASTVKHVDRCLSCLSCMTTCPSGVHYMHLVDHARAHIEATYKRPLPERLLRRMLAVVLPSPGLFRASLIGARLAKPFARFLPGRLKGMVAMAPKSLPKPFDVSPRIIPAQGERRMRVALLTGCAQNVLDPEINEATIRLLTRHGVEVCLAEGAGCCGALTHHMGFTGSAHAAAAGNIRAWMRLREEKGGLDAVVINASGCGTTVKDYGHMFRADPTLAEAAAVIAGLAKDVTEVMESLGLKPSGETPALKVAYHSACSLQHGQKIAQAPKTLLKKAGFSVVEPAEGHLCCGSAGTYNLLQPEIAGKLKARKLANLARTKPDVIAAGNIGCMTQLSEGAPAPIVHTAQLLDWATGGPRPAAIPA